MISFFIPIWGFPNQWLVASLRSCCSLLLPIFELSRGKYWHSTPLHASRPADHAEWVLILPYLIFQEEDINPFACIQLLCHMGRITQRLWIRVTQHGENESTLPRLNYTSIKLHLCHNEYKTGMYEDIKAQGLSYQYMETTGKVWLHFAFWILFLCI